VDVDEIEVLACGRVEALLGPSEQDGVNQIR